jgi:hypothetical protein
MSLQPLREQANRVRVIPLRSVLLAAGAEPDRDDPARWHTVRGAISVTGMKFYNWNRAIGGGGAIDLVIHLNGLDFKSAVRWLCRHFPDGPPAPATGASPKPNLKLPSPAGGQLAVVKEYLVVERRIPPALIDRLIRSGDLYADAHANAVFLLRGKSQGPVGAELRGTGPQAWRGLAPGSRKDLGYFAIGDVRVDRILLCESAIDALSCFSLRPHSWCISAAGARPHPAWLPFLLRHGPPVYCAFDADPTGDDMAQAMMDIHPSVKRLRPPKHDWNDVLKSQPDR